MFPETLPPSCPLRSCPRLGTPSLCWRHADSHCSPDLSVELGSKLPAGSWTPAFGNSRGTEWTRPQTYPLLGTLERKHNQKGTSSPASPVMGTVSFTLGGRIHGLPGQEDTWCLQVCPAPSQFDVRPQGWTREAGGRNQGTQSLFPCRSVAHGLTLPHLHRLGALTLPTGAEP